MAELFRLVNLILICPDVCLCLIKNRFRTKECLLGITQLPPKETSRNIIPSPRIQQSRGVPAKAGSGRRLFSSLMRCLIDSCSEIWWSTPQLYLHAAGHSNGSWRSICLGSFWVHDLKAVACSIFVDYKLQATYFHVHHGMREWFIITSNHHPVPPVPSIPC